MKYDLIKAKLTEVHNRGLLDGRLKLRENVFRCEYRAFEPDKPIKDLKRCAIGALIDDEDVTENINMEFLQDILELPSVAQYELTEYEAQALQAAHDEYHGNDPDKLFQRCINTLEELRSVAANG